MDVILSSSGRAESVHISNDAPYIGRLNAGSSSQAPAGFVQRAIADGIRAAKIERQRRSDAARRGWETRRSR